MSVRTMARVWSDSKQSGSDLLMLLAIADFADDEGNAYPAVPTLAAKCRTTPRHANRILSGLRASGELEIRLNEGPKGTNRYRVALGGMTHTSPLTKRSPLTHRSRTPDVQVPKPLTCASDEPSLNHHEPSLSCAKRSRKPASRKVEDVSELSAFEAFWSAYPRKVSQVPAAKAFAKLAVGQQLLDTMLLAISAQGLAAKCERGDAQFVPYPSTWLNQKRWLDQAPASGSVASAPTSSDWAVKAGFANRYEAENAGCYERNASTFRDGRRLKEPA